MAKSTLPAPVRTGEGVNICDTYALTSAQVKTLLNRAPKGTVFAISAQTHLPIESDPDRYFPGSACLVVGYTIALKYAQEACLGFEHRGGRMSVRVYPHGDSQFIVVG